MTRPLLAALVLSGLAWLGTVVYAVREAARRPPAPDAVEQAERIQRRLQAIDVLHCGTGEILVATCEAADVRGQR